MLKSLTFGLSLVLALGLTGVSKAGLFGESGCANCASPQGDPHVSPQSPLPSPQGCDILKKKCDLFSGLNHKLSCFNASLEGYKHSICEKLKPKPKVYTYEWVLKKKRVWNCALPSCDTLPTPQSSPQAGPSSPQSTGYTSPQAVPAYGSGQLTASAPAAPIMAAAPTSAPAAPAAPLAADEVPPAPAVPAAAPETPAPTTPEIKPPQTSLLFSTPSGN